MSRKSAKRPLEKARTQPASLAKVPIHLAASPQEFSVTQFEQGLLCAAEAFYRFYGALLGRDGRRHKLAGQDNVILQQIMAASRPLGVADIARFANRDDIANIQYSLKKLLRARLIAKSKPSSMRETTYGATELAHQLTRNFVALRRTLFTNSVAEIADFHEQLAIGAKLLNTITGLYDHGTRVLACVEQTAELDAPEEEQSARGLSEIESSNAKGHSSS
jgi:predicted MarR family transcription regulator